MAQKGHAGTPVMIAHTAPVRRELTAMQNLALRTHLLSSDYSGSREASIDAGSLSAPHLVTMVHRQHESALWCEERRNAGTQYEGRRTAKEKRKDPAELRRQKARLIF